MVLKGLDTATVRLLVKCMINPNFMARDAVMFAIGHWDPNAESPSGVVAAAGGLLLPYIGLMLAGSSQGAASPVTPATGGNQGLLSDLRREEWMLRKARIPPWIAACMHAATLPLLEPKAAPPSPPSTRRLLSYVLRC